MGVAASHCITWFQTQLILTTYQICYHCHCGIIPHVQRTLCPTNTSFRTVFFEGLINLVLY